MILITMALVLTMGCRNGFLLASEVETNQQDQQQEQEQQKQQQQMQQQQQQQNSVPIKPQQPGQPQQLVTSLTSKSFDRSVRDGNVWLIEFYAPWCVLLRLSF